MHQTYARLAKTTGPKLLSTVERGTAFEERSLRLARMHLSMALSRVGGKSDGGVDLQGWWWLPSGVDGAPPTARRRLRILAQCKAEAKKLGPNYVREMEGVLYRHIHEELGTFGGGGGGGGSGGGSASHNSTATPSNLATPAPLVAVLMSQSAFTREAVLRAQSSHVPFLLLHLPPLPDDTANAVPQSVDNVGTVIWNPALGGAKGLLGGEIDIRWERAVGSAAGGGTVVGRPGLWTASGERIESWVPESNGSGDG
jgi:hypothetical protein